MTNIRGVAIYPPKSRSAPLHVAGKLLESRFALCVEQTLLLQLLDLSADSLHTSVDHLTIERIHLAVVVKVNSLDSELFSVGIAISRYLSPFYRYYELPAK